MEVLLLRQHQVIRVLCCAMLPCRCCLLFPECIPPLPCTISPRHCRVALQTDMEAAPAPKQAAGKKQQREQGGRSGSRAAKRQKTNGGAAEAENGEGAEAAAGGVAAASVEAAAADAAEADCDVGQQQQKQQAAERQVVSKPVPNGRGHTGYLTFARRVAAL